MMETRATISMFGTTYWDHIFDTKIMSNHPKFTINASKGWGSTSMQCKSKQALYKLGSMYWINDKSLIFYTLLL